jgi:Flp pilus assembly protein TadG
MCIGVAAEMKLEKKLFKDLPGDNRGHVMVEFGLGYSFVLLLLAGTVGFGHLFYVYNSAQSAVRSATRFASLEAYDLPNGAQWKTAVKNMAVYGTPAPQGSPDPLIYGWSPTNITVTASTIEGIPESVRVEAQYDVQTPFFGFSLSEPRATFPYLGKIVTP